MKKKSKLLNKYYIMIISLILLVIGVTYSFVTVIVKGNDEASNNIVKSNGFNVEVTFDNSDSLNVKDFQPGDTVSKTFTIKNKSSKIVAIDLYLTEILNTFINDEITYSLECSTTSEACSGKAETVIGSNPVQFMLSDYISAGALNTYTLKVRFKDTGSEQTYNENKKLSFRIKVNDGEFNGSALSDAILNAEGGTSAIEAKGTPSFRDTISTDEGMYATTDQDGTTYYYRGNVLDNYVYFANKMWRIVRINGDGTVRLILEEYAKDSNGNVYNVAYNSQNSNISGIFVPEYGYGTYASTSVSIYVNEWFNNNIIGDSLKYVVTSKFCNDASVDPNGTNDITDLSNAYNSYNGIINLPNYNSNFDIIKLAPPIISTPMYQYGAKYRMKYYYSDGAINPSLMCMAPSGYSGEAKTLNLNAGLITADEVVMAGAYYFVNVGDRDIIKVTQYNYLTNTTLEKTEWTMSPALRQDVLDIFTISNSAEESTEDAENSAYIRPVINIKGDMLVSGTGTSSDPYKIVEKEYVKLADNVIENAGGKDAIPEKANLSETDQVFRTVDQDGITYMYRQPGDADNNYVKFADTLWRIIRVNGDGSVRLMRSGFSNMLAPLQYSYSSIPAAADIAPYINYNGGEINTKSTLDNWYNTNIKNYEKYLVNGKFCNNYQFGAVSTADSQVIVVGTRTVNDLTCSRNSGLVNGNVETFNSYVGLISTEEAILLGNSNGLYTHEGIGILPMNPLVLTIYKSSSSGSNRYAISLDYMIRTSALQAGTGGTSSYSIAPVINMKGDTIVTGSGTKNDPYVLANEIKTVTYVSGETGEIIATRKTPDRIETNDVEAPHVIGYNFAGWYLGDELFDFKTRITDDITLTAKYVFNGYVVNYDCNGGNGAMASSQMAYDEYTALSKNKCNNFTTGSSGVVYSMAGWATSRNSNVVVYSNRQLVRNIAPKYTEITLYAVWEKMFDYTGTKEIVDDGRGNWIAKFLTSGTLTAKADTYVDLFLVGGGGGAGPHGGGGGGGYTATYNSIEAKANTSYEIVVGAGGAGATGDNVPGDGGASSAFSKSVEGGKAGGRLAKAAYGGNGGSGGGAGCAKLGSADLAGVVGGSNGTNGGSNNYWAGGTGQGTTTRAFGEESGTLFSGGGGGYCGTAGAGGGGNSATATNTNGVSGTANTGGGGGAGKGNNVFGGSGGSGIIMMRNSVEYDEIDYTYTGNSYAKYDSNGDWKIYFLTSGTLTFNEENYNIDAFLVGGGSSLGGSGYTTTQKNISVTAKTSYSIVVGAGGTPGNDGSASKAFNVTANPGSGLNGGSGGGAPGYTGIGCTGGTDGSNGTKCTNINAGVGQGTTTREFGESSGTLYAGGGGGGGGFCGGCATVFPAGGKGGERGAGNGGGGTGNNDPSCTDAEANTGSGAGTGNRGEGKCTGGSGIVVIRNHR